MSLRTRTVKIARHIKTEKAQRFRDWLKTLTDEELKAIADERGHKDDGVFSQWLETLTDEELETFCYDRPGANALRRRYDEYKKQTLKN